MWVPSPLTGTLALAPVTVTGEPLSTLYVSDSTPEPASVADRFTVTGLTLLKPLPFGVGVTVAVATGSTLSIRTVAVCALPALPAIVGGEVGDGVACRRCSARCRSSCRSP